MVDLEISNTDDGLEFYVEDFLSSFAGKESVAGAEPEPFRITEGSISAENNSDDVKNDISAEAKIVSTKFIQSSISFEANFYNWLKRKFLGMSLSRMIRLVIDDAREGQISCSTSVEKNTSRTVRINIHLTAEQLDYLNEVTLVSGYTRGELIKGWIYAKYGRNLQTGKKFRKW